MTFAEAGVDTEASFDFCPGIAARRRLGPAATVLWVHGYTIDASTWSPLWDLLPEFGHIGIDMPGHGASPPLAADETLEGLGRRLAEAALVEGIRHVVGLSLGSMLSLQIAMARPDAFETLVLGAPALAGGPTDASVGRRYVELAKAYAAGQRGASLRTLWMQSPPDLFRHAKADPQLWERLEKIIDLHPWSEFSGPGVARFATGRQHLGDVARLRCRTLLMIGEHEFQAFCDTAKMLDESIADCCVAKLPGVGHLSMLEAPDLASCLLRRHWTSPRTA